MSDIFLQFCVEAIRQTGTNETLVGSHLTEKWSPKRRRKLGLKANYHFPMLFISTYLWNLWVSSHGGERIQGVLSALRTALKCSKEVDSISHISNSGNTPKIRSEVLWNLMILSPEDDKSLVRSGRRKHKIHLFVWNIWDSYQWSQKKLTRRK